ncbi:hypothetical protein E2C01_041379 [Portunus trituberculatus]|uniref:Uncharacterized protein n=1 Tax=Portunus trituberculatus TaxID=210409 RepID=A0A5B7FRR7_PORTR|nr:hypothetical protein [Portunus trituberculatus]
MVNYLRFLPPIRHLLLLSFPVPLQPWLSVDGPLFLDCCSFRLAYTTTFKLLRGMEFSGPATLSDIEEDLALSENESYDGAFPALPRSQGNASSVCPSKRRMDDVLGELHSPSAKPPKHRKDSEDTQAAPHQSFLASRDVAASSVTLSRALTTSYLRP